MDNYSESLQKNEEQRKALVAAAEKVRQDYGESAVRFLNKWFENCAKEIVTSQPAITNRLKKEDISELKAETKALAGRATDIIASDVLKCPYWHDFSTSHGNVRPNYGFINDALRVATARIVPILRKRGYNLQSEMKNGRLEMGGYMAEDEEMKNIREKYNKLSAEISANRIDRFRIEERHEKEQAKKLWDSA